MATPAALKWTIAGSLVVAAAGGYFLFRIVAGRIFGDVSGAGAALPAERAAARKEGLPLEPEDLFPNRPVDPKKNAAPILKKEGEAVSRLTPSDGSFMKALAEVRNGTAGDWHVSEMKSHIQLLRPHLDRIVAASKLPVCDFGSDYSRGYNVLFPQFAGMKKAVHVLSAQAWLSARKGDFVTAGQCFTSAFRLAKFSGDEPVLIGSLVQIACSTIAFDQLRRVLREHSGNPRCLAMASSVLKNANRPVDLRRALNGELVWGIASIRLINSLKDIESLSDGQSNAPTPNVNVQRMRSAWEARFIQFWRRTNSKLPKDPLDYMGAGRVLASETVWEEQQKSLDYLLNQILMPVFEQSALACCKERAQYAMSKALLSLLEFRRRAKRFPDRLDQVGEKFLDPFDGKPLRYEKTGAGFKIWSIDRDLRDDGGLKRPAGQSASEPGDFVVEFS